ncbi:MAG TPA: hypothetical protein VF299_09380 [Mycobacterium sp.]
MDNIQDEFDQVPHPQHRLRIPAVPFAAALLFFLGPAIAFLSGDRADLIENRQLARMPSLDSGWQAIPRFNAWAVDHLPLRAQAVRANTYLSESIFHEPPLSTGHAPSAIGSVAAGNASPDFTTAKPSSSAVARVIQGKDGWLYLADDFSLVCDPRLGLPAVIDGLKRLHAAVESSGRKLVISIIPDKATAVPQYLPESFGFKNCSESHRSEFWEQIVASGVPFIDLRGPLVQAERAARHPMYLSLNTHWSMQGAAVWTKAVLAALDGNLTEGMAIPGIDEGVAAATPSSESPFVAGPMIDVQGDLTVMLGAPRKEPMLKIELRREGVTLSSDGVALPNNAPPPIKTEAAGLPKTIEVSTVAAPLYPGQTLFLGDSFYDVFGGLLFAPFMSTLTPVYVLEEPAKIMQNMINADTVVLEVVERSLSSGGVPLIQPDALAQLERTLAAHHR